MKQKYQGTTRVKRQQLQALRKEFETLQMKEEESVDWYFARTLSIANKMRIHGATMKDVDIIEKILQSMSSKFGYVVCSIEESHDIDTMTIDELQGSLQLHEQRMAVPSTEMQALKVSIDFSTGKGPSRGSRRGRDRGGRGHGRSAQSNLQDGGRRRDNDKSRVECFRCGNYGHYSNECYTKMSQGKAERCDVDKSRVECSRCGHHGHYSKECYSRNPKDKRRGESSNFVEKREEEETLLLAAHAKEQPELDVWYIDTGCSNHMCGSKSSFSYLNEDFRTTVQFGDSSTVNVMGKGDIDVRTKNNHSETISNVFYVPALKTNLLSAGQLQDKGYMITFQKGACEIYHPKRGIIAIVQMTSNRLFLLRIKSVQACLLAKENDSTWLWHLRYGHLNFNGLRTLHQKQMVTGLPLINPPSRVCEECVISKHHRDPFPKRKT